MMRRQISVAVIAFALTLGMISRVARAENYYFKYEYRSVDNPCEVSGNGHSIACCTVDGWDWSGDNIAHPRCPIVFDVWQTPHSCRTDLANDSLAREECSQVCGCGGQASPICGGFDTTVSSDGAINPASYQCDRNDSGGQPEVCDGRGVYGSLPVDAGCGLDEAGCNNDRDQDPSPVRYTSGRVESVPIEVFAVPAVAEIFFGYRLKYNSHVVRAAAQRNTVNGVRDTYPIIHHSQEDTHFVGFGWLDNFGDRLYITAANTPSTTITWTSQDSTITFQLINGAWKSTAGRYELIDRGSAPVDGFGRWVVRTTDATAPREIWAFEDFTYTPYDGSTAQHLGRLRRHAVLTSDLTNLSGRYGYTVTWTARGTIASASDTLGRSLEFSYHDETQCIVVTDDPATCSRQTNSTRLEAVGYRPNAAASAVTIATLQTTSAPNNDRLERVLGPTGADYTRFLYQQIPPSTGCVHCNALLTDVVIAGDNAISSPGPSAAVQADEIAIEHDDYMPSPNNPSSMVASHSQSPGREYAYEYTYDTTTQFDLHLDGGACGSGNSCAQPGYACRTVDQPAPHCYAAEVMRHDPTTFLGTQHAPAGSGTSGDAAAFSEHYAATGLPTAYTDASNTVTSYGFDSQSRIRCIIHNDNDNVAFVDPSHPDTSDCAGPSTSQIVRVDYTTTSRTTTTPSVLAGSKTTTEVMDLRGREYVSRPVTGPPCAA